MKPRTRPAALAAFAAALFLASGARATPNFPNAIKDKLAATEAPECAVCHVTGKVGGRGTVNTAFGMAMRGRGLVLYDEASLGRALDQMEKDGVDSDGDGTIDVDALRMGKNPNSSSSSSELPTYGCVGRVAPVAPTNLGVPALAFLVLAAALIRRRRIAHRHLGHSLLVAGVVAAALVGCAAPRSGAALAPRSGSSLPQPPRMAMLKASTMDADLRAAGLDPANLPAFETLSPRQLRRVMGTFTRSLGLACTDCHEQQDYKAPTRMKRIAARMWNEMVRPNSVEGAGAPYCDSCHQGQGRFLDRSDKKAIANYMSENYTEKIKRGPEKKDVECETCHGDPFDPKFVAKW